MSTVLIGEILSVAMFLATIGAVLIGYPVAFTLAGVALLFAAPLRAQDPTDRPLIDSLLPALARAGEGVWGSAPWAKLPRGGGGDSDTPGAWHRTGPD